MKFTIPRQYYIWIAGMTLFFSIFIIELANSYTERVRENLKIVGVIVALFGISFILENEIKLITKRIEEIENNIKNIKVLLDEFEIMRK